MVDRTSLQTIIYDAILIALTRRGFLYLALPITPCALTFLSLETSCKPLRRRESSAIADESLEDANFSRPFHYAFLEKKVICPDSECFKKLLFFEKIAGLGQHYRVIHKKTVTEVVMKKASETMRQSYGQETLEYICFLAEKKSMVSS